MGLFEHFFSPTMTSEARRSERSAAERKGRDALFSSRGGGTGGDKKRKKRPRGRGSSATESEAQSIQRSLLRTEGLLQNELERVSTVQSAIDEDGRILRETTDHHKSLNTKNAQKALTALERAERQEQYVLMASVAFFALVSFEVLWKRVLVKFDFVSWIWTS